MKDHFGRNVDYMRVSVTDRCNFRCRYCMPHGIETVPMERILTYEQIEQICAVAAEMGINKFKITGGEPLVRSGCVDFITRLKQIPGVEQVTLTTNGPVLAKYMQQLKDAGLDGVNISLDSMDPACFAEITGGGNLAEVQKGIDAAIASGVKTKINCLMQKGVNDTEWLDFVKLAFDRGIDVRFIELMPIGYADKDVGISNEDLLARIKEQYPAIEKDTAVHGNGPAEYYHIPGQKGGIGFISGVHGPFCTHCNRIRLTAQGWIKPCLSYETGVDVGHVFREQLADPEAAIRNILLEAVNMKPEQSCFEHMGTDSERHSMMQIGG